MGGWALWTHGEALKTVTGIQPGLPSWDAKSHPAQVKLRAYLDEVRSALGPTLMDGSQLFLAMQIGVEDQKHLLAHHDVENYLTPVVAELDPRRFVLVTGEKRFGGSSRIVVGKAQPLGKLPDADAWRHLSVRAGSGAQTKAWKQRIRTPLLQSGSSRLPDGPVEVQLAWRGSSKRNWAWLWKPTGDALGPVLGEPNPANPFSPADDRIVSLAFHYNADDLMGHCVDVGIWWRAHHEPTPTAGLRDQAI